MSAEYDSDKRGKTFRFDIKRFIWINIGTKSYLLSLGGTVSIDIKSLKYSIDL